MNNSKRIIALLLTAMLTMAAFPLAVSANDGGHNDPSENVLPDTIVITTGDDAPPVITPTRPSANTSTVTTPTVPVMFPTETKPLTPDGNSQLVDDITQAIQNYLPDKQFITVQTRNGHYFYVIVDRSQDEENVYFLNQVDEADLFALLEKQEEEPTEPYCTCMWRCGIGSIDASCPVCYANMKDCGGIVKETEPEPTPAPTEEVAEPPEKAVNPLPTLILLLALGAGGAVYWFRFRTPQVDTSGEDDLDDYDYGQDENEESSEEMG